MSISLPLLLTKYFYLQNLVNKIDEFTETSLTLPNLKKLDQIENKVFKHTEAALKLIDVKVPKEKLILVQTISNLVEKNITSSNIIHEDRNKIIIEARILGEDTKCIELQKHYLSLKYTRSVYTAVDMLINGWEVILDDEITLIGPLKTKRIFSSFDCSCNAFISGQRKTLCNHLCLLGVVQENKELFI